MYVYDTDIKFKTITLRSIILANEVNHNYDKLLMN